MRPRLTHESNVGELVVWAIEHDAITEERWSTQQKWNESQMELYKAIDKRLSGIENKMNKLFIFAGCGALLGSVALDFAKLFVQ